MNVKLKKITTFAASAAIVTSIGIQVLIPKHVDAAEPVYLKTYVSTDIQQVQANEYSGKLELASPREFHTYSKSKVGVKGLDYDKVIKWQQNVDEGRELWRLDPMQVARVEGKKYGFTEKDGFSIVKMLSSSSISRYGQIDIEVTHQGKTHTMTMVKPFAKRGTIWTTYKIDGALFSSEKELTKVLFKTNKYKEWKYYKSQYPEDMFFATIINDDGQLTQDDRISKDILKKFKGTEFNNKLILFASMGTSSAQSNIGIERVTVSGKNMTVYVHTKSPHPDQFITMNIIYPDDYVTIDRSLIEERGTMKVTFVDQNGKILSKNKLKIKR
ncbi:MAG: hypothetical protein K0R78_580 [Pelosinus sp.]|nr:hypothetical protein [Pelosinus sp.]